MLIGVPKDTYRGNQLHEFTVKLALQKLCPDIHFDLGASLDLWHPKINRWQGVFCRGRHIGAMGRGSLPEFNLYREELIADGINDGQMGRGELLEIGWRTTLQNVVKAKVGVTWDALCRELNVEYLKFTGDPMELAIPDKKVDEIHRSLG
jgi:hypothetical protein